VLNIPTGAAAPRSEKYIRDWIPGLAGNRDSNISSIPPQMFTGGEKVRKNMKRCITPTRNVPFRSNFVQSLIM